MFVRVGSSKIALLLLMMMMKEDRENIAGKIEVARQYICRCNNNDVNANR